MRGWRFTARAVKIKVPLFKASKSPETPIVESGHIELLTVSCRGIAAVELIYFDLFTTPPNIAFTIASQHPDV